MWELGTLPAHLLGVETFCRPKRKTVFMALDIKIYNTQEGPISNIITSFWHATSDDFEGPEINFPDGYYEAGLDLLYKRIEINLTRLVPTFKASRRTVDKLYIRFTPYGLFLLTKIPTFLLTRPGINIHQLFEDRVFSDKLVYIAFSNPPVTEKIKLIEDLVAKKSLQCNSVHPSVKEIAAKIIKYKGASRLNEIFKEQELSDRSLEMLFAKDIGLNPKPFSKVVRLGHLILDKFSRQDVSLTELSYEYGYSDQSHMIRDFRAFLGEAPLQFFKRKQQTNYVLLRS